MVKEVPLCVQEYWQPSVIIAFRFLNMRILIPTLVIAFCCFGCCTGKSDSSLVGQWVCKDLRVVEHIAQFAKWTTIFRSDGQYVAYLTNHDGTETQHQSGHYTIQRDTILFDDGAQTYHFAIANDLLTLTVDHSQNKEDIGKILVFHRIKP